MTGNGKVFLILLFTSLVSLTVSQDNWWESGISKAINLQNIDETIGKDKHVIVEVFAQYCFYCKMVQPEWDKLAEHYMGDNENRKDVIVGKIDAGVEPAIADRYGVNAYPTFLFFKKNDVFPTARYNGERTSEKFIQFINSNAGPEEKAPVTEEPQDIFELLNDAQRFEELPPQDPIIDVQVPNTDNQDASRSEDIDYIVQKLDFLVDLVHSDNRREDNEHRGKDMSELKTLIGDIDKKITHKTGTASEEINFAHGMSFLLLGVCLGIGVSFGIINYQKLARSRKLKLLD